MVDWLSSIPGYAQLGVAYCLFVLFIFGYMTVGLILLGQENGREIKAAERKSR